MKVSTQDILAAVIRSLDEDVIPFLERESWVTSSTRSCVQLLTYLQDRIKHERAILLHGNRLILDFLREVAGNGANWALELRNDIETAVNAAALADEIDVDRLNAVNQQLKEVLTKVVHRLGEARTKEQLPEDGEFRDRLHACLSAINSAEQELFARARLRVPI